jgi:ParB/RepB/Spo0J family partition protein
MATTAPTIGERSNADGAADGVQLRHLPLSRIVVPDGFNPRGEVVEDREFEQMVESIRQHGCLQPIRVRATEHGDYVLIAGERRYRAAVKAAVMELPAIIRPVGAGDEDKHADLLVEALIENDLRRNLDALARARGYQRLVDSGRTIKGVAERLQTTQARVREHLRVLKLPDALQRRVAAGEIPLRAVKPLAQLESIHPGLSSAAVGEVLQPADSYEAYAWADVERAPLEVALASGELPEGIYRMHTAYPLDTVPISDGARKDLAALERMLGRTIAEIRFDATDLAQARALGAAHGDGWQAIIVGTDVAAQLAADQLARAVKTQRQQVRAERERVVSQNGVAVDSSDNGTAGISPPAEQDVDEAKRAEREVERAARGRATQFNLELGRGVYTTLSRVRVDEAVLKILASVEIVSELPDIAMRGARYGLPGWVSETPQKNGRTKYGYLERAEAEQRAREYLGRAEKAGEIAGRQVALLAMATYADQSAVATSNRSWHHIKASGPWAGELDGLLDALVREKLPESTLALLGPVLAKRGEEQAVRAADREAREQAKARLERIEDRIAELSIDQIDQAEQDLESAWSGWMPRHSAVRQMLNARRDELTAATADQ